MKKNLLILIISLSVVLTCMCCGKKNKKTDFSEPDYLLEKKLFKSKWKRMKVEHPSGFWQVIKKEKWMLLYNNQDAPVQMILDANLHVFSKCNNEKAMNSFIKSLRLTGSTILSEDSIKFKELDASRIVLEADVLYNYWEDYSVKRKIEILVINKNKRSYVFAYIADKDNFDKYRDSYEKLMNNFTILEPEKKNRQN